MDNTALFKLGYGLYVLSAKDGEKDNGCIINTMIQTTQNPLTAVIALNKQNFTHDMIVKGGELKLYMGRTPSSTWGVKKEDRPL